MEFDATFLFAAVSFILFVIIMNKIFYAPVLKIMRERQKFVEQNFETAAKIKQETQQQEQYREAELEKSREQARNLIAEHSQKLKSERSKRISQYKSEVYNNIIQQQDNLKNSAIEAKEVLKDSVVNIAKDISTKLLGHTINIDGIEKSKIEE